MKIPIACPECHTSYQVPEEALGRNTRCKRCGKAFLLQQTAQPIVGSPNDPAPDALPSLGFLPSARCPDAPEDTVPPASLDVTAPWTSSKSRDETPGMLGRFRIRGRLGAGGSEPSIAPTIHSWSVKSH